MTTNQNSTTEKFQENENETAKEKIMLGSIWNKQMMNKNASSRRLGFHSRFLILKNYLGVSPSARKTQIDSLLKKSKSKCFKNIHEAIKKCIKGSIGRLPQDFITNIKIEFNKNYMNKSILQIYQEYEILPNMADLQEKNVISEEKKSMFEEFVNLSFKDAFELYLTSQQYLKDYDRIKEKENENFAVLFNYISRSFVQYYTYSKGNKPKSEMKSKKTRINRIRKIKLKRKEEKIFKIFRREEDEIL